MCNLDKFKERTKRLCAENGIQLKFVHQKLGRGTTYLNDAWRGKTTLSDGEYDIVADILNTTPAYLRGETDDPSQEVKSKETPITPAVQELIDEVYGMTDNEAAAILSLIREIKGRRA